MTLAIAYVRDVKSGDRGEAFGCVRQREMITRFAEDCRIEIAAWFEDKTDDADVLSRPGIQAMLAYDGPVRLLLCARIGAISNSFKFLEPFLPELERRNLDIETVDPSWDCVSQQYRRHRKALPVHPQNALAPAKKTVECRVKKPKRLYFERMAPRIYKSMH